jgi:ribosomal protein S18 acetylase RimI-like enzyme
VNVVVRLADRRQATALARLNRTAALAGYRDIFPDDAPKPTHEELLSQWEHWLGPDRALGRRAFAAFGGREIVGAVLAGPDPADADEGHLSRLYVHPGQWGRGIGRQLYDAAVGHLREKGFPTATLWVLERNERARSWYERLGWRPTGERKPVYTPAGIDDVGYRIDL